MTISALFSWVLLYLALLLVFSIVAILLLTAFFGVLILAGWIERRIRESIGG